MCCVVLYCVLRIVYCVLCIAYCVLRIVYCVLCIAYCVLRIEIIKPEFNRIRLNVPQLSSLVARGLAHPVEYNAMTVSEFGSLPQVSMDNVPHTPPVETLKNCP